MMKDCPSLNLMGALSAYAVPDGEPRTEQIDMGSVAGIWVLIY